jgi:predicted house-cleaning noncanonical NTP pyrophosphatase (MazG superfamily)
MKGKILLIFLISIFILPIYGEEKIPEWVKNNAKLWSENQIDNESYFNALEFLIEEEIIQFEYLRYEEQRIIIHDTSEIFHAWSYENDFYPEFENMISKDIHFKLMEENEQLYKDIGITDVNAIVILPVFTSSAYSENGFYEYFFDRCNDCTTVKIVENNYLKFFVASQMGARTLEILGYKTITDVDLDKNPNILKEFDTVILLHNEYVTQSMFNSIVNHPHVIYLYPNALYAEIEVDYKKNEITLIRGHGYPESTIMNGFDWEFDNTHPYEYDIEWENWEFYRIPNGEMLNCYPERKLISNIELLKELKDLVD